MQYEFLPLLIAVTDLGDSAILGALAFTVSSYLLSQRCHREAGVMMLSFVIASAGIGIVKIALMSCGSALWQYGMHSPSGHSALSIATYGTLGLLLGRNENGSRRWTPFCILLLLAFTIALTRVALHFHSLKEVAVGIIIGCATLYLSYRLLKHQEAHRLNVRALLFMFIAVAFLLHGFRFPGEQIIRAIANHFKMVANCV